MLKHQGVNQTIPQKLMLFQFNFSRVSVQHQRLTSLLNDQKYFYRANDLITLSQKNRQSLEKMKEKFLIKNKIQQKQQQIVRSLLMSLNSTFCQKLKQKMIELDNQNIDCTRLLEEIKNTFNERVHKTKYKVKESYHKEIIRKKEEVLQIMNKYIINFGIFYKKQFDIKIRKSIQLFFKEKNLRIKKELGHLENIKIYNSIKGKDQESKSQFLQYCFEEIRYQSQQIFIQQQNKEKVVQKQERKRKLVSNLEIKIIGLVNFIDEINFKRSYIGNNSNEPKLNPDQISKLEGSLIRLRKRIRQINSQQKYVL